MESTELRLRDEHLAGCLALSKSANWNQNQDDWRLMLQLGRGWGVMLADGTLAASTLVLPYNGFSWVSMVLVLPEHRKKGFASHLLRTALADLKKGGQTPILDATPAGQEVYAQEGFRDTWRFSRFKWTRAVPGSGEISNLTVHSIGDRDWPSILRLDAEAFGASRETVLRNLASRLPRAALVAERAGQLAGFMLGRDGREANQLGPLVARDSQAATALLGIGLALLRPPLYIDLLDREVAMQLWLRTRGFEFQRPFTRMVHGEAAQPALAPGNASLVFCPAGPELG